LARSAMLTIEQSPIAVIRNYWDIFSSFLKVFALRLKKIRKLNVIAFILVDTIKVLKFHKCTIALIKNYCQKTFQNFQFRFAKHQNKNVKDSQMYTIALMKNYW